MLQHSFIPNQIMMPANSNGSMPNGLDTQVFPPQPNQGMMRMQSAPEPHDNRRMSLKLFQDLSRDLMSNAQQQQQQQVPMPQQSMSSDVSMAGSTASVHDDPHNQNNMMGGDQLDHIFDDDIESVGEPVALEAASPYVQNGAIPADLAEGLLRSMFSGQVQFNN